VDAENARPTRWSAVKSFVENDNPKVSARADLVDGGTAEVGLFLPGSSTGDMIARVTRHG